MKVCRKCHVEKPFSEFHKSASRALGGVQGVCKACMRGANEEWRTSNPDKYALQKKRIRLRRMGLTLEQFEDLAASQDYRCAICRTTTLTSDHSRLSIDHDHSCCPGKFSCGKCIRGLLCAPCNQGLGNFKDNLDFVLNAADYLRRQP